MRREILLESPAEEIEDPIRQAPDGDAQLR
jgi:hypothetical protein